MRRNLFRSFSSAFGTFRAEDTLVFAKNCIKPDFNNTNFKFGNVATDHMVKIYYDGARGWQAPEIRPFEPLLIHPFNSTLHYALSAFEGMKAYKCADGSIRLFRPMMNMERFLRSAHRLAMPSFDPKELLAIVEQYVLLEKNWIPESNEATLYIRPLLMSMTDVLGVHRAANIQILIMASPVLNYFSGKIRLSVREDYWRGSPKSAASYKLGANYAPTVLIGDQVAAEGFSQALWVYDNNILESGATNIFFVIEEENGKLSLVTPPLDGSILPGVTRDSILYLAKDIVPEFSVFERYISLTDFVNLFEQGRIKEVFVTGTASVVGEVDSIEIRGKLYDFKYSEDRSQMWSQKIRRHILDIQFGRIQHPFSHIIKQ